MTMFGWMVLACGVEQPGPAPADPNGGQEPTHPAEPNDPFEPTGPTDPTCVEVELEPAPTDWLFLVDTSGSWDRRSDRWEGLNDALADFLDERGADVTLAASHGRQPYSVQRKLSRRDRIG